MIKNSLGKSGYALNTIIRATLGVDELCASNSTMDISNSRIYLDRGIWNISFCIPLNENITTGNQSISLTYDNNTVIKTVTCKTLQPGDYESTFFGINNYQLIVVSGIVVKLRGYTTQNNGTWFGTLGYFSAELKDILK